MLENRRFLALENFVFKMRRMLADEDGTAWVAQIPACICTFCGIGCGCCGWSSIIYDICDLFLNCVGMIGSLLGM